MSRVAVKTELLRWARERSGLRVETLAEKFPKFRQWESGEAKPTLRQLEALARKTYTPLGYFFLPEPPDDQLPIPDYRTADDIPVHRPSPNLLETVQTMLRRQAWMREFLLEQGQPRLPYVGSAKAADNPVQVAEEIRATFAMDDAWAHRQPTWTEALRAMRLAVEEAGVLVVINGIVGNNTHRKLNPNEFRGFVLADDHAPLVFVNGADGKAAQMFTLAHEIAHVWLSKSAAFDLRDLQPADNDVEKASNRIAAELLVPGRELRRLWPSASNDPEPFQTIARAFKVSSLVAARRALDLNLIDGNTFFDFYRAYLQDERRTKAKKPTGGNFYATQDARVGRKFAHTVARAAKEGRLLYREAYELTGLYGRTFDRYSKSLGFGGRL